MLRVDYRDVAKDTVGEDKSIRWVIGPAEGAPNFTLRVIEFEPGAIFEEHRHPYEHEIFVLAGEGTITGPERRLAMRPGHAFYVPPDEPHSYRNTGDDVLRFICIIPNLD